MRKIISFFIVLIGLQATAQDTTMNSLTKGMDNQATEAKKPVHIFNSERLINANTNEIVGKGKMDFKVTHNFSDIAGHDGGIKNFFGLDNSTDIRIGFDIGITDRLNLNLARVRGDVNRLRPDSLKYVGPSEYLGGHLYEMALKYQLLRQLENDPGHPVSVTLYAAFSIASVKRNIPNPNTAYSYKDFGDRMNQVYQVIIAKKIKKVSVQLTPTLVHYNFVPTFDRKNTFAIGAAFRVPLSNTFALIVDYIHPFISDAKEDNYYKLRDIKFHDPLGVGIEVTTAGHVFHMNFTNATAISDAQIIPYNTSSWGKGQYRWGFNISRTFVLWRPKK